MPSYCCAFSDFPQSHYIVLSSFLFPFACASWWCSLFLVFLRFSGSNLFLLSYLLLSHRSRISAVTQGFFFWWCFAKDLTGCFSHCCVESGDHWIHVCIFIVHDGEMCELPTYLSLEDFQHNGSFSFSRSNSSLLCFGLLILFRWMWKVIIINVTSPHQNFGECITVSRISKTCVQWFCTLQKTALLMYLVLDHSSAMKCKPVGSHDKLWPMCWDS